MNAPTVTRRERCPTCRRARTTCYCAHLRPLATRTRVLLLQHPRERGNAIGTARMAHLVLAGSQLRVGVELDDDPVVREALAAPAESYVLFPGPTARDVSTLPSDRPITLVVLDGTWSQARKLLAVNPRLAALPRVGFVPRRPSDYRIRRQPAAGCVSTIEALAEVLEALEPDGAPERFAALLDPFRVMVDEQLRYARTVSSARHLAYRSRPRRPRVTLGARLAALGPRLVLAHGDANGWPGAHPARPPAELVYWVAVRADDGQTFEQVIAPRRPLAPHTATHVELTNERLVAGATPAAAAAAWAAFLRPDDVLVHFGVFHRDLALALGLPLPTTRFDLRAELRCAGHPPLGDLETLADRLRCVHPAACLPGRAGRRLAALRAIVERLRADPDAGAAPPR